MGRNSIKNVLLASTAQFNLTKCMEARMENIIVKRVMFRNLVRNVQLVERLFLERGSDLEKIATTGRKQFLKKTSNIIFVIFQRLF